MESELVKVEKLQNIEQWSLWKFQLRIILKANDLFDVVLGTEKKPADTKDEQKAEKLRSWNKADCKAQKIIVMTLGQEPMLHVISCENSHQMWTKLESVYEQKSNTSVHLIQQRFYSFEKVPQDNIATHISKLKQITQQLKDLGETVSESMIITKILMTLPSDFSHFYTAWESTSTEQKTLDNLTARLMMEESRLVSLPSTTTSNALIAKKTGASSYKSFSKPKGKCFLCKQRGHWKSACPSKKQYQSSKPNFSSSNNRRGDAFVSNVEKCERIFEESEWYLDSGASDHMSNRKEWFVKYIIIINI